MVGKITCLWMHASQPYLNFPGVPSPPPPPTRPLKSFICSRPRGTYMCILQEPNYKKHVGKFPTFHNVFVTFYLNRPQKKPLILELRVCKQRKTRHRNYIRVPFSHTSQAGPYPPRRLANRLYPEKLTHKTLPLSAGY